MKWGETYRLGCAPLSPSGLLLLLLLRHTVTEHIILSINHRRRRRCRSDGLRLTPSPSRRWRRFVQIKLTRLIGIHSRSSAVHRRLLLNGMTHAVRIVRHAVMLLMLRMTLSEIVIRHLVIRRGKLMRLMLLLLLLLRWWHGRMMRTRWWLHGGIIIHRTGVSVSSVHISFAFGHRLINNMPQHSVREREQGA